MRTHGFVGTALLVALSLFIPTVARAATPPLEAVRQSPIKGGLCVVLGSADATLGRDLAGAGSFAVHLLATGDVTAAREEAISYAAYRVLTERYLKSVGASDSLSEFDDLMDSLCLPLTDSATTGDSPAALGNQLKASIDKWVPAVRAAGVKPE